MAVSIINSENPYETASILGVVIEKVVNGAQEHFNHLAKKYLNLDRYPITNIHEKRVILKIKPQKVYYILIPLIIP